jgi:hypothetical protein
VDVHKVSDAIMSENVTGKKPISFDSGNDGTLVVLQGPATPPFQSNIHAAGKFSGGHQWLPAAIGRR